MFNLNQPLGVSRKRGNETETGTKAGFKRPPKLFRPVPQQTPFSCPAPVPAAQVSVTKLKPGCDNRLLAGCMANEFLTKGTLFGEKYDPARVEAAPLSAKGREGGAAKPIGKHESYAEVANLLKSEGVHIPGIVNPTQLARWLQM